MPKLLSTSIIIIIFSFLASSQFAVAAVPLPIKKSKSALSEKKEDNKKTAAPFHVDLKNELMPLNSILLSKADKTHLNKAIKAIYKNRYAKAINLSKQINNQTAKNIITWYALRNLKIVSPFNELTTFLKNNPGWPSRSRLQSKIEVQLYKGALSPKEIIKYISIHKPKSLTGKFAHAEALIATEKKVQATKIIRDIWQNPYLPNYLEKQILTKYPLMLTQADHKSKIDRLLYLHKKSKIAAALRTAKKVGKSEESAARFRAAVIKRQYRHARKLLSKLDKATKARPGVYLSRIELARRSKKMQQALKLATSAKYKATEINNKDQWWTERRKLTRYAISELKYETAYKIASNHSNPSVNKFNEAEFLSGWLALQFLNKPKLAEKHFANFKKTADGPRTKSKSAYWMGRTQQKLKNEVLAKSNFKESATLFNTYYGQLSAQALNKTKSEIKIPELAKVNKEIAKRFTDREEIKTLITAHLAGSKTIVRLFFFHLRYHLSEPSELVLLAKLAADLGYNQSAVRIGKTAMSQGIDILQYAYPIKFMPSFKPLRTIPERALIFSIARQESEFNYQIRSHAGARGLLQVMPNTLKHVARKYKIKRQVAWLTQKPAYNAQIASAYIGDRHEEFGGSYIMTFAGFNAGPGRVRQWIKKFGDPRSGNIDPIDWVERIPFKETRNYVQKVLANVQIYRARLKKGTALISTHQDLHRGKF